MGEYRLDKVQGVTLAQYVQPQTLLFKKKHLALLDMNEDFLKHLSGGDPASSHTSHYINPFMSANLIPCCHCGQATNLFLKTSECLKNVTEVLKLNFTTYMETHRGVKPFSGIAHTSI